MNLDNYLSWGRYPRVYPEKVVPLFWLSEIPELNKFSKYVLPYAYGKSYGDSCLNEKGILLDTKNLNRFISFDAENGTIKCEAGTTLASILDFILPQKFFLATTPGTKYISVGGAIANDVHGKNHHRGGTFGTQTLRFELIRSDGERYICSPNENSELFKATIGGLGLTGLITWAEIKLKKCPSEFIEMESIKFDCLEEFFDISEDSDKKFEYTVAWVDSTASDGRLGRGLFNRGNHCNSNEIKIKIKDRKIQFPFDFPFINPFSVNVFNMLYFNKQIEKIKKTIVHYNSFFYPLDAILSWNKAYGKNGFVQYQFVVPFENKIKCIKEVLKIVANSSLTSFLTVLKTFGDVTSPGMLSFPMPGVTLAIDFKFVGEKTLQLCSRLDEIVRANGGRLYPAKDARMSAKDFQSFYPNWKEFSEYIDPKFSSSFWRRVTKVI